MANMRGVGDATTKVIPLPAADSVDQRIGDTVEALRAGHGISPYDLAAMLGTSYQTMRRRLRGQAAWTAAEVQQLADFFRVSVSDLYTGNVTLRPGPGGTPRGSTDKYADAPGTAVVLAFPPTGPTAYRRFKVA